MEAGTYYWSGCRGGKEKTRGESNRDPKQNDLTNLEPASPLGFSLLKLQNMISNQPDFK